MGFLLGSLIGFIAGVALTAGYKLDKTSSLNNELEYLRVRQQDLLEVIAKCQTIHQK